MFLQILGIVFLLIILVVAYYAWKLYRFIKKQKDSDIYLATSVLPMMDLELESINSDQWKEVEQLNYNESELKKVGASHLGYFAAYTGMGVIRISLWDFKNQAVGAIYEACADLDPENVTFMYEVGCKLKEGSVCLTSNPHASFSNRPENHKIAFKESNCIIELLKSINAECPEGLKYQKIQDPKEFFMECYEDMSEWCWQEAQIRNNKTQQTLSSIGIEVTDELIDELIEMGENHCVDVNINRARKKLANHSKISVSQWEKIRDDLVFINNTMKTHHIVSAIYDLAGDLTEQQEQVIEGFEQNSKELVDPIEAFHLLLQTLNIQAKRVTSIDTPVKTEIFLPV
ncbi:hypothetical protein [Marinicellulosiphila megalodicopiae]|uniref:hypothetical protein n=1 Tax=Marinicellulosiphila megalodicopiae TaxID=2724896 RepID=UPI003BB18AF0